MDLVKDPQAQRGNRAFECRKDKPKNVAVWREPPGVMLGFQRFTRRLAPFRYVNLATSGAKLSSRDESTGRKDRSNWLDRGPLLDWHAAGVSMLERWESAVLVSYSKLRPPYDDRGRYK